eukprot:188564-Chlamydomonas_euryale.AAC.1
MAREDNCTPNPDCESCPSRASGGSLVHSSCTHTFAPSNSCSNASPPRSPTGTPVHTFLHPHLCAVKKPLECVAAARRCCCRCVLPPSHQMLSKEVEHAVEGGYGLTAGRQVAVIEHACCDALQARLRVANST